MPHSEKPAPTHAPMDQFPTQNGELIIGGIPLSRLAERAGQTPFYAYDRHLITQRVQQLRSALPPSLKIHYAMKANPMPALVCHMAGLVDGFDVASAGELKVSLDSGTAPNHISLAGPGKSARELKCAVAAGILINIESFREIDLLEKASEVIGQPARVAVRINPDFELKASGMKMGGGAKPFGVDAELVPEMLRAIAARGLNFEGFHLYPGSQNLNAISIAEAQRHCYELVLRLIDDIPASVRSINLGGGFGIPYFPGERRLSLTPIAETLAQLTDRANTDFPDAALVIELGRYLVGEAGIYVARIIDRKTSRGQTFLVTDGGLHHHLSASGNFGQVIRKNFPIAIGNRMGSTSKEIVSVVGPLCTPLDVLGERVELSSAKIGDLVTIFQSGAYGMTASPQAFLGHAPCAEILV